jgi:serine/threonine protein kinase
MKITSKSEQDESKQGMLPFLNTKHLKMVKDNIEDTNLEANDTTKLLLAKKHSLVMNQLLEMAGGVARQIKLQNFINNQNILATFVQKDTSFLNIPDNTLLNTIYNDKDNSFNKILTYMHDITQAVEFLHNKNIAHGDIKLSNVFTIEDEIKLSGFERFSFLDSSIPSLGVKKFTFCNNIYQAPEVRYPLGKEKKWCYTNATLEGDIYSLGMVFAGILYTHLTEQFDPNKLVVSDNIFYYVNQETAKSKSFNRNPDTLKQDTTNQPPIAVLSQFYFKKNNFMNSYYKSQEEYSDVLNKLIDLINYCHQETPEHRPTATAVKDILTKLMEK